MKLLTAVKLLGVATSQLGAFLLHLFFGLLFIFGTQAVGGESCQSDAPAYTRFGSSHETIVSLDSSRPTRIISFPDSAPTYYRLRIGGHNSTKKNWQLILRDSSLRPLQILRGADFSKSDSGTIIPLWTNRLKSSVIHVDLVADGISENDLKIQITEEIVMPESGNAVRFSWKNPMKSDYIDLYSFVGVNDKQTNRLIRMGDRIGLLASRGSSNENANVNWCCSGVFLSHTLFMTNWHCGSALKTVGQEGAFWKPEVQVSTFVDRGWSSAVDSSIPTAQGRAEYSVETLVTANPELDYALLRLTPFPGNTLTTEFEPTLGVADPMSGDDLVIIHHPECKPKQISVECHVRTSTLPNWRNETQTDFGHDCDTEGGSSGAPVFKLDGTLLGLHHFGFEVKADGQCDQLNKAIKFGLILDDLAKKLSAENSDILSEIKVTKVAPPN